MTKINADVVQFVKKTAKERFSTDVTDNKVSEQSLIILTRRYHRQPSFKVRSTKSSSRCGATIHTETLPVRGDFL